MGKIKDKTQAEINREQIESTIEFLHQSMETIEKEIQDENVFGVDPETGFITKRAHDRIFDLNQQKRDVLKNIHQLEFQLEVYTNDRNTPAYRHSIEEDAYDLIAVMEQYEKEQREYQEENALQEIREAREHGLSNDKSHELTR